MKDNNFDEFAFGNKFNFRSKKTKEASSANEQKKTHFHNLKLCVDAHKKSNAKIIIRKKPPCSHTMIFFSVVLLCCMCKMEKDENDVMRVYFYNTKHSYEAG